MTVNAIAPVPVLSNTQKRRIRRNIIKNQTHLFKLVRTHWRRHLLWNRIAQCRIDQAENIRLDALRHTVYMPDGTTSADVPGRTARDVIKWILEHYGNYAIFEHGCEDQLYDTPFYTQKTLFALPINTPADTSVGACVPDDFLTTATCDSTDNIYREWGNAYDGDSNTTAPLDMYAVRRSDGTVRFAKMIGLANSPAYIRFIVSPESKQYEAMTRQYPRSDTIEKGKIYTWKGVIARN